MNPGEIDAADPTHDRVVDDAGVDRRAPHTVSVDEQGDSNPDHDADEPADTTDAKRRASGGGDPDGRRRVSPPRRPGVEATDRPDVGCPSSGNTSLTKATPSSWPVLEGQRAYRSGLAGHALTLSHAGPDSAQRKTVITPKSESAQAALSPR